MLIELISLYYFLYSGKKKERESKNVTNKRFTRNQRIFKKQKTK